MFQYAPRFARSLAILVVAAGLPSVAHAAPHSVDAHAPGLLSELPRAWDAAPSLLQEVQGSITGQVVSTGGMIPLEGAQVFFPALNRGALTQQNGRFLLLNVPAGTHALEVRLLGYQSQQAEVTIGAGERLTRNFELPVMALQLDELVVTGTGVVTERRRLGQTVATLGSAELEALPVSGVTEALSGRIAGVYSVTPGEPGSSAPIVLRGAASLSQRVEPLIYIDGVRIDNSTMGSSMVRTSALDQLNVSDIERVEVIKGAAAATLYGSQASSGVIQIFTKRGVVGPPVYSMEIEQQVSPMPYGGPGNWGYDAATNTTHYNHPFEEALGRTGYRQNYSLSVRGGTQGMQYSGSGRYLNETGNVETAGQSNGAIHLGLAFQPMERLQAQVDAHVVRNFVSAPHPDYNVGGGPMLSNPALADSLRPYGELFYRLQDIVRYENELETHRLTATGSASMQWTPNLVTKLTAGVNRVLHERVSAVPVGHSLRDPQGFRVLDNSVGTVLTVDGAASWQRQLSSRLSSTLVLGGQTFREDTWGKRVGTRRFSSPALRTLLGGADVHTLGESFEQVINAGVFAQEQLGIADRLFLTAGVRLDGSSAFGEGLGFEVYPKAGASWVVSEHAFWNVPWVDQFRVRAAVGTSGMQPGSFDSQRMWRPASLVGNQPVVLPLNLGNPDLKPERSIEREAGVEMGMAGGRIGLEVVYFDQETRDALLPRPSAPSEGFLQPQLTNLATLTSRGVEASLDATLLQRRGFTWRTTTHLATLDQEITDMGGVEDFVIVGRRRFNSIAEGYSPGAVIAPVYDPQTPYSLAVPVEQLTSLNQISPNLLQNASGRDSMVFIGNSIPTLTGAFSSTVQAGSFTVAATFTGAAGFIMTNETEVVRESVFLTERIVEFQRLLDDPATSTAERQRVADEFGRKHYRVISAFMEEADFIRFQELSVGYRVPERIFTRLGMSSMQVSLAARNLAVWTGYSGVQDPLTTAEGGGGNTRALVGNVEYMGYPPPRRFSLRVQTMF